LELQPREEMEVLRIINIALLCVHNAGERRPDMKAVMAMLHGSMDLKVAHLVLEHESERLRHSRLSMGLMDSSTSSKIRSPLMSRD